MNPSDISKQMLLRSKLFLVPNPAPPRGLHLSRCQSHPSRCWGQTVPYFLAHSISNLLASPVASAFKIVSWICSLLLTPLPPPGPAPSFPIYTRAVLSSGPQAPLLAPTLVCSPRSNHQRACVNIFCPSAYSSPGLLPPWA